MEKCRHLVLPQTTPTLAQHRETTTSTNATLRSDSRHAYIKTQWRTVYVLAFCAGVAIARFKLGLVTIQANGTRHGRPYNLSPTLCSIV
jgi:hypothetical protein